MERDAVLVRRCLQGDREAMEALVTHYEQPLYNAAYRLLGNAEDAADVCQTTFLKAFQALDRFDPGQRFFSWIYRITLNEARDQLRRRATRGQAEDSTDLLADATQAPDAAVGDAEQGADLQSALMALPEEPRTLLVMHYVSGATYQQMADVLGVSEQTVKSRLYSARQRIKVVLERQGVLGA